MKRTIIVLCTALFVLLAVDLAPQTPEASPLRILSSNGVRAPLEDVQAEIAAAIGRSLDIEFSTAASLATRIESGEPFDVAILTPALIDRLVGQNLVAAEPRRDIARTGVGVGARSGEIDATIETIDDFKDLLLDVESIAFTAEGQSRRTIDAAFERLGIAEAMRAKAVILGPGEAPLAVAAGDAQLVLTLISEILPVPGLSVVGPFPEALQAYVGFEAGVSASTSQAVASSRLLEELASGALAVALRARGLEPLGP